MMDSTQVSIEDMKAVASAVVIIGIVFVFWMAFGIKKDGTKIQEEYPDTPYEVAAGCGKGAIDLFFFWLCS